MSPSANGKTGMTAPVSEIVATTMARKGIVGDFVMLKTGRAELLMNGEVELRKRILIGQLHSAAERKLFKGGARFNRQTVTRQVIRL